MGETITLTSVITAVDNTDFVWVDQVIVGLPTAVNANMLHSGVLDYYFTSTGETVTYSLSYVVTEAAFAGGGFSFSYRVNYGHGSIDNQILSTSSYKLMKAPLVNCTGSYLNSTCSASCGDGIQTQSWNTTAAASGGGTACPTDTQTYACNAKPCPVNCNQTAFSGGICSATCGAGTITQTRTTTTPASNGGTACGPTTQTIACRVPCSLSSSSSSTGNPSSLVSSAGSTAVQQQVSSSTAHVSSSSSTGRRSSFSSSSSTGSSTGRRSSSSSSSSTGSNANVFINDPSELESSAAKFISSPAGITVIACAAVLGASMVRIVFITAAAICYLIDAISSRCYLIVLHRCLIFLCSTDRSSRIQGSLDIKCQCRNKADSGGNDTRAKNTQQQTQANQLEQVAVSNARFCSKQPKR